VRDLRARWEVKLISRDDQASADYRALQPFGQVPVLQDGGLVLFESGSIVLYVADKSEVLMPKDPAARARAITWVFAAVNTIEVQIQQLAALDLFYADQEWSKQRRPEQESVVKRRLSELAAALGDREYLEGRFTAGDLIMTTVLRVLRHTNLLDAEPKLAAYKARCEARPAFRKALGDQLAAFGKHSPPA
jgi:glutathione S-transferase